jgi:predicted neutral ceramidase superfamily lipid hydrolase
MNIFVKFDNWLARGFDPNPANRHKLDQWLLAHSALARRLDPWLLAHITYRGWKRSMILMLGEIVVVLAFVAFVKYTGYRSTLSKHEYLAAFTTMSVVALAVPIVILFCTRPKP